MPEEIKSLSECKSVSAEAIVVDWRARDFEAGEEGADIVEEEAGNPCEDDPARRMALFNVGAPKAQCVAEVNILQ